MAEEKTVAPFVPFWFETNELWGAIRSYEEWEQVSRTWASKNLTIKREDIYTVNRISNTSVMDIEGDNDGVLASFGNRTEHIGGDITLGEFFDKNNMLKI